MKKKEQSLILFDGVCNLCNRWINFIIDRDIDNVFRFATLQSKVGKRLIEEYEIPEAIDSIILIEANKVYYKSLAILRIFKKLTPFQWIFYFGKLIPILIANKIYDLIAKSRYKLFGKEDSCRIPTPELLDKFLK